MGPMLVVSDIMSTDVVLAMDTATIKECAVKMNKRHVGSVVIFGKDNKPYGIITEGDISRAVSKGASPSTSVMKLKMNELIAIEPWIKVEEAARLMAERHVKKLPVINDHVLVGIITQTDIINSAYSLITTLKEMVHARYVPPDMEL
jgi:CBS domain-containing protein